MSSIKLRMILFATGLTALTGRAEIQLRGVLTTPKGHLFGLFETNDGETKWVSVGQTFHGYAAAEYEIERARLRLEKDGERTYAYMPMFLTAIVTEAESGTAPVSSPSVSPRAPGRGVSVGPSSKSGVGEEIAQGSEKAMQRVLVAETSLHAAEQAAAAQPENKALKARLAAQNRAYDQSLVDSLTILNSLKLKQTQVRP